MALVLEGERHSSMQVSRPLHLIRTRDPGCPSVDRLMRREEGLYHVKVFKSFPFIYVPIDFLLRICDFKRPSSSHKYFNDASRLLRPCDWYNLGTGSAVPSDLY